MTSVLVPIFICVVLPVAIVLIIYLTRMSSEKNRTRIIMRALEKNEGVDLSKLAESLTSRRRTPRELLDLRLLRGCMFSLIGVVLIATFLMLPHARMPQFTLGGVILSIGLSYLIVYFVTKRHITESER